MAESRRIQRGEGQIPNTVSKSANNSTKKAPLEASVVKNILKYINSLPNARAIKVPGDAKRSGEPDIDACIEGKAVKLEVKRPGNNRVTTLQKATLEKWAEAGAIVGVVHSVEEVKELLERGGIEI